jgi:hypothetical protein
VQHALLCPVRAQISPLIMHLTAPHCLSGSVTGMEQLDALRGLQATIIALHAASQNLCMVIMVTAQALAHIKTAGPT